MGHETWWASQQILGMMVQMVIYESRDEEVAMVIALLQAEGYWEVRCLCCCLEVLRFKLDL